MGLCDFESSDGKERCWKCNRKLGFLEVSECDQCRRNEEYRRVEEGLFMWEETKKREREERERAERAELEREYYQRQYYKNEY
jgi:hypothetical protein